MESGQNVFPLLVSGISGNPISGLTLSDFTISGIVGGSTITSGSIAAGSDAGYYLLTADTPTGQGYIRATPTNTLYSVAPEFYEVDTTNVYSTDDVYASIARQTLDTTQIALTSYESQNIGPYKEGDDVVIEYFIPDAITTSISGYSNFKASLYNDTILTSISGSGYIADFVLTVDTSNNAVTMHMPSASTRYIVAEGITESYFYSDLQATDEHGYNKTLAEFSILFRRNFTRP